MTSVTHTKRLFLYSLRSVTCWRGTSPISTMHSLQSSLSPCTRTSSSSSHPCTDQMPSKVTLPCTLYTVIPILQTGGEFGAIMQVHIQNDGPITLQFETPNLPPAKVVKVWLYSSFSGRFAPISAEEASEPTQSQQERSQKTLFRKSCCQRGHLGCNCWIESGHW